MLLQQLLRRPQLNAIRFFDPMSRAVGQGQNDSADDFQKRVTKEDGPDGQSMNYCFDGVRWILAMDAAAVCFPGRVGR